ncbi:MAG: hypothetical protein H6742_14590 [Alphaproteobacteria bacterium]|nr:hypothetical protein [Alphaproteobacteria bacterium]
MLLLLPLWLACAAPCDLASDVPGFTPVCDDAVLGRYADESRLVVLSEQGRAMVAYLPADLEERPYGGTTGLPVTVVVETDQAELVAGVPEAWLRIEQLDGERATVSLDVEFDEGRVAGTLDAEISWQD